MYGPQETSYTDAELSMGSDPDVFAALADDPSDEELLRRAGHLAVEEASHWWDQRSAFRNDRRKNRNFYASRPWEESVVTPDGTTMSEKEYIERQGRIAMSMNLISNVVNNVEGQFRQNKSERQAFAVERKDEEATRMMNLARRAMRRYNGSEVIEADQFKEHILSGASCFKSTYQHDPRLQRYEVKDAEADQARLFYNMDIHDRRFRGLRIIGEIHDVTIHELVSQFSRGRKDEARIRHLYAQQYTPDQYIFTGEASFDKIDGLDFRGFGTTGHPRVLEIWKPVYQWVRTGIDPLFTDIPEGQGQIDMPESDITRIQNARREMGLPLMDLDEPRLIPMWHAFYCTPHGTIIHHHPTPYRHGEHPYSPGLAMLVDGETWGMVTPIRDPQRWMNRLLANIDHMMSAGAKGAVAYDLNFLNDTDLKQTDVDSWYTSMDGSLGLNLPQGKSMDDFLKQFHSREIAAGYFDLLPMIQGYMDQISGVSGALKGEAPTSGTPAALYQQQIIQASTNVLGYMQTYFEGLSRKDRKELQLIQQTMTEPRQYPDSGMQQPVVVDPDRIKDIDWDIAMGDVADTSTYRQLWESDLNQYLQAGLIPFDVYLQASSHPRAEFLQRLLQNHQATQGMTPEMMQALQQQTQ